MTITLTAKEDQELWDEAALHIPPQYDATIGSGLRSMPRQLGSGYDFYFETYPGCWLGIGNCAYREQVQIQQPESGNHPIQFAAMLSGAEVNSGGGGLDNRHAMISGAGVQRSHSYTCQDTEPILCVNLELSPQCLLSLFPTDRGELPSELQFLVKPDDWQTLIYPNTNPQIQRVAREIVFCPYQGSAKRLYLQAKTVELIGAFLAPMMAQGNTPTTSLKPRTIARLYEAQSILQLHQENPPSLLELAQLVGLSKSTLQKGFHDLFGTTVFGYLTECRMVWAAQQLRETHQTVAEIANRVGYVNPAQFAAAFKRKFGMTPSECAKGKKVWVDALTPNPSPKLGRGEPEPQVMAG